jgi:hypothetical protein
MARTKLAVSMLAFVIAGCSTTRLPTAEEIARSATCQGQVCKIDIRAHTEGSTCVVDAPAKDDIRRVTQADTEIRWKAPRGYEFCHSQGDGVWFITATDQFYDGGAIDDPDEGGSKTKDACKPVFRWFDRNETKFKYDTYAGAYRYKMQFRSKGGANPPVVCTLDPWIVNN